MKLTTQKALDILNESGLSIKYTTFMKWVREGKVKASMNSTKEGYRIEREELERFLSDMKKEREGVMDPFERIEELSRENEKLRHRAQLPDSFLKAENLKLTKKVKELEKELIRTKEDQTIYIKVE
jgi:hypothetical protein